MNRYTVGQIDALRRETKEPWLEFQRSADVLLTLIIGGTGWLYGGIAGAIAFKILQDVLSSTSPQFWMFWMGIFLVVLALVGRERLAGGVRGLVARMTRP